MIRWCRLLEKVLRMTPVGGTERGLLVWRWILRCVEAVGRHSVRVLALVNELAIETQRSGRWDALPLGEAHFKKEEGTVRSGF